MRHAASMPGDRVQEYEVGERGKQVAHQALAVPPEPVESAAGGARQPCRCQPCSAMPVTQRLRWRMAERKCARKILARGDRAAPES